MQIDYTTVVSTAVASIDLDWPEAIDYCGYASILEDLKSVGSAAYRLAVALEADGPRDAQLLESLTWMIVVRYGRCFNSCDGRKLKLNAKKISEQLGPDSRLLHEGVLKRRNKAFAHAGELCAHGVVAHLVDPDIDESIVFTPRFSGPGAILEADKARLLVQLIADVHNLAVVEAEAARSILSGRARREFPELWQRLLSRRGRFASHMETAAKMARDIGLFPASRNEPEEE